MANLPVYCIILFLIVIIHVIGTNLNSDITFISSILPAESQIGESVCSFMLSTPSSRLNFDCPVDIGFPHSFNISLNEPTSSPTSPPSGPPSFPPSSPPTSYYAFLCPSGTFNTWEHIEITDDKYIYNRTCEKCPMGTYNNAPNVTHCDRCPYPFDNHSDGSTSCPNYHLDLSIVVLCAIIIYLLALYFVCIFHAKDDRLKIFLMTILSVLDRITNTTYILHKPFLVVEMFYLSVLVTTVPSIIIFYRRLQRNYCGVPKLFPIVPYPGEYFNQSSCICLTGRRHPKASSNNALPQPYIFDIAIADLLQCPHLVLEFYSSITIFAYFSFWLIALSIQLFVIIVYVTLIIMNLPFHIVWLLVGINFYQFGVFSVSTVWNLWFQVWIGNDKYNSSINFDTAILNETLIIETMETGLFFIIQSVNSVLLNQWSPSSIFSFVTSGIVLINGISHYGYYAAVKGYSIYEIQPRVFAFTMPVSTSIVPASPRRNLNSNSVPRITIRAISPRIHDTVDQVESL